MISAALVPVAPLPAFGCYCYACGRRMQSDREPIMADPKGPAFEAYYCAACAAKVSHA